MDAGDPSAAAVYEAHVYQVAKETGAMAAVLEGAWMRCCLLAAWHTPNG